jgi:FkbM family methyltransferase
VLDVGANIGFISLIAAQQVGESGHVWAFEPVPNVVKTLIHNIDINGYEDSIRVVPVAVGDALDNIMIHVSPAGDALASVYVRAAQTSGSESIASEVRRTTLDTWAAEQNWPAVDVVKIDVEGSEIPVLRGMSELSRRNLSLQVIIEFNVRTLRLAGKTPADFLDALRVCGLDRVLVIDYGLEQLDAGNGLRWLLPRITLDNVEGVNLLCMRDAQP